MTGYAALTRKELWGTFKTYRLLIVSVVFIITGLSGPLMTYYLPDIIRSSSGNSHIQVIVGKQTAVDAINAYLGSVTQLPMLVIILVAMGTIADERSRGVASLILYRPVSRVAYLLAKATSHGTIVVCGIALGAASAFYYTAILFPDAKFGPFLLVNLGLLVTGLDVLALTLLCSAVLRSGVAAGGAAFVAYLAFSTLPRLWQPLADSLPTTIPAHFSDLMSGTWTAADLTRPLLGGLAVALAVLACAYAALRHQEV